MNYIPYPQPARVVIKKNVNYELRNYFIARDRSQKGGKKLSIFLFRHKVILV